MYTRTLFPKELRVIPDYGGLPGLLCLRYTCPKCGLLVKTEVNTEDLLRPLSLPCENKSCSGYTLSIVPSFSAFALVLTGPPPTITLFQPEAEANRLREAVLRAGAEDGAEDYYAYD